MYYELNKAEKRLNSEKDNSSQISEDTKWFLFSDGNNKRDIVNEFGFSHGLKFDSWCKDGHSFIITDADGGKYRINISKED